MKKVYRWGDRKKRDCSIPGCFKKYYAKGFCSLHWAINRKAHPVQARMTDEPRQATPLTVKPTTILLSYSGQGDNHGFRFLSTD